MGIALPEIQFFAAAMSRNLLPREADILEFGESEVFGSGLLFLQTLAPYLPVPTVVAAAVELSAAENNYVAARALYRAIFNPSTYTSIDRLPGTSGTSYIVADLNEPVDFCGRQWSFVINNGTSEHVFDRANFYRATHDACAPGGTMVHFTPGIGLHHHGFCNSKAGLFLDLADANGYEIDLLGLTCESGFFDVTDRNRAEEVIHAHPELARRAEICAVLKKSAHERPFSPPIEDRYRR